MKASKSGVTAGSVVESENDIGKLAGTNDSRKSFPRTITRSLKIHEASEGIGSRTRRCIGNRVVRCLPPFVVCEQFRMDETGRPPHPSRGAQKITYVLSGTMRMEYSSENTIELGPGDVTSLMVGKGVIRSTRAVADPENQNGKKKASATGIQIYMDVPEPFKRLNPSHLNLCHSDIVTCEPTDGCCIRILTGSVFGAKADQMLTTTPALILDCTLEPGASIDIPVKPEWNAFAFVIEGSLHIQGEKSQRSQYVEFMRSPKSSEDSSSDDGSASPSNDTSAYVSLAVSHTANQKARVLFCAAKPLCQPIYRQGPFIDVSMNWIHQAFDDYTGRKNGFESGDWNRHRPRSYTDSSRSPMASSEWSPSPSKLSPSCTGSEPSCSRQENSNNANSREGTPPYNPCEQSNCESDSSDKGSKHRTKASYPNVFPPGSVNPASNSTTFNSVEAVEEQQEQKIPRRPESPSRKRRRQSESCESDVSDTTNSSSPPPKR